MGTQTAGTEWVILLLPECPSYLYKSVSTEPQAGPATSKGSHLRTGGKVEQQGGRCSRSFSLTGTNVKTEAWVMAGSSLWSYKYSPESPSFQEGPAQGLFTPQLPQEESHGARVCSRMPWKFPSEVHTLISLWLNQGVDKKISEL